MTSSDVISAGGLVIELMVDTTADAQMLVNSWVTADGRDLNCTVLHDKDGVSHGALTANDGNGTHDREWAFIVDTSTMEIVWRAFGSTQTQLEEESSAVQGLVQMCTYLGC